MSQAHKLSLPTAIIINMNIMLGAGIFVNTISLSKISGILSPFSYLIVGILMLPLVMTMAKLLKIHPAGSFYKFGRSEISPIAGFMGSWSYFVGKLASSTLMIHFASLIIQNTFTALHGISVIWLDLAVISIFTALNLLNMKTNSKIQTAFVFLKVIPVLLIIVSGMILFNLAGVSTEINWSAIPFSIPLVAYAFAGFEASCSLSAHIKDAKKNAPIATLASFFLVVSLSFLYQLMFYGMMGAKLSSLTHYFQIFPSVIDKIMPAGLLATKMKAILQLAIATSSLGGAYGVLFSNSWNLHALADNKHLPGSGLIARLNQHGIPTLCVIAEAAISIMYVVLTQGNNIPLQQVGAFGCTLAYAFCVLALMAHAYRQPNKKGLLLPSLGIISCTILLGSCINAFIKQGGYGPVAFFALMGMGIGMFYMKKAAD